MLSKVINQQQPVISIERLNIEHDDVIVGIRSDEDGKEIIILTRQDFEYGKWLWLCLFNDTTQGNKFLGGNDGWDTPIEAIEWAMNYDMKTPFEVYKVSTLKELATL